jgi:plasmid stabilization system protein ParE
VIRLVLRPGARADLCEIERFSIAQFGPAAAEAYMDRLESALDRLLDYPESAPSIRACVRPFAA